MGNKVRNIFIGVAALFFIGVATSGGNQTEVKGTKTEPTITVATNIPIVTAVPTNTPKPTAKPTDTPIPTKKYIAPTPTPTKVAPQQTYSAPQTSSLSNDNYYTNSAGNEVHSPAYSNTIPAGATAQCGDGTYSFSQSRRGTCSHHGGVASWL